MTDNFRVKSTSLTSAQVQERELSRTKTTRKVVRANLHDNPNDPEAAVKITIIHQRKANNDEWEDVGSTPLSKLKANEAVRLALNSAETLALRRELERLYAIYESEGIRLGDHELVVAEADEIVRTSGGRAEVIRALMEHGHSDEVWETLVADDPDLATRLSIAQIQQDRQEALRRFRELLDQDVDEATWQRFLDRNTWIFGYGLDYRFLGLLQSQPDYGGRDVRGRGGHRGDNLVATHGDLRFTVLVEVKKASTDLLGREYRKRVYPPSKELAGGISQLQVNCQRWEVEGARTDANREVLGDVLTVKPKGILVVGRGDQLGNHDRKVSFELIRRNTLNPEIITFDELLARAEFIVSDRAEPGDTDAGNPADAEDASLSESDDGIPF